MNKSFVFALPLAGLVLVMGTVYGLDIWIEILRQSAFRDFSGTLTWLIPASLAQLAVAGLLLAVMWLFYKASNRIVGLIYLLVGFGSLFYLVAAIALEGRVPLPLLEPLIPGTFTSFTSAMIAVMGFLKIVTWRPAAGHPADG
jgi:hypothetical protein